MNTAIKLLSLPVQVAPEKSAAAMATSAKDAAAREGDGESVGDSSRGGMATATRHSSAEGAVIDTPMCGNGKTARRASATSPPSAMAQPADTHMSAIVATGGAALGSATGALGGKGEGEGVLLGGEANGLIAQQSEIQELPKRHRDRTPKFEAKQEEECGKHSHEDTACGTDDSTRGRHIEGLRIGHRLCTPCGYARDGGAATGHNGEASTSSSNSQRCRPTLHGRARWQTLFLGCFVTVMLVSITFLLVRENTLDDKQEEFNTLSQVRLDFFSRILTKYVDDVELVADSMLFPSDGDPMSVSLAAFDMVANRSDQHLAGKQALEFIPRVEHADRAAFEAEMERRWQSHVDTLTDDVYIRASGGVRAANRSVYYPVSYLFPYEPNSGALLFDLGSNPDRLAALNQSATSRSTVVTGRIRLVQDGSTAVLVFVPVFNATSDRLLGFGLGVVQLRSLLRISFAEESEAFDGYLYDTTDRTPSFLHAVRVTSNSLLDMRNVPLSSLEKRNRRAEDYHVLEVGGREWTLVIQARDKYFHGSNLLAFVAAALIGGIGVVTIASVYLALFQLDILQSERAESAMQRHQTKLQAHMEAHEHFLNYVAHELRNPLHGMRATLYFLLMPKTARQIPESIQEDLQTIHSCCTSMFTFLNAVLDRAQFQRKEISIKNGLVNIAAVVRDVTHQFRRLASVPLQRELDQASVPKHLLMDESRLRQVLSNVVSNAIKHTQKGRILISVTAEHADGETSSANSHRPIDDAGGKDQSLDCADVQAVRDDGEQVLRITVEDTGCGLKGVDPETVFEEFEQVSDSTEIPGEVSPATDMASTGLGLPICRRIVQAMGGSIALADTGHGCCMTILLPCVAVTSIDALPASLPPRDLDRLRETFHTDHNSAASTGSAAVPSDPLSSGEGRASAQKQSSRGSQQGGTFPFIPESAPLDPKEVHIVLADDEKVNRKILERMLKHMGVENVTSLSDGSEVVELLGLGAEEEHGSPKSSGNRPGLGRKASMGEELGAVPNHDNVVLLLDIVMLNVSGDKVCTRLRKQGWTGRIVACTGNASAADRERYLGLGFNTVISKPFTLPALHAILTQDCNIHLPPLDT